MENKRRIYEKTNTIVSSVPSITGKLEKDETFDKGISKSATRYND